MYIFQMWNKCSWGFATTNSSISNLYPACTSYYMRKPSGCLLRFCCSSYLIQLNTQDLNELLIRSTPLYMARVEVYRDFSHSYCNFWCCALLGYKTVHYNTMALNPSNHRNEEVSLNDLLSNLTCVISVFRVGHRSEGDGNYWG